MTDELDPVLQSVFKKAASSGLDDGFTTRVMAEIDTGRRHIMVGWTVAAVALVVAGWFLYTPLQGAVTALTQFLPSSLVELEATWVSHLLAPINSVAGLIAIGFFATRAFFRKLFA